MQNKVKTILIIIIILLSGIIVVMRGNYMKPKQQEIIPQEVIEFAKLEEGGKIYYQGSYKEFKVYSVSYPELETGVWGLPSYILFDGSNLRWVRGYEALSLEIED